MARNGTTTESVAARSGRIVVGIDTGGTFTDVIALDWATGRISTAKTPSTPDDPSIGFANGIEAVRAIAGACSGDIARVLHGTTVATNLILEGKGAPAALLVPHCGAGGERRPWHGGSEGARSGVRQPSPR